MLRSDYKEAWVYKTSDMWRSGIPDIIICHNGRFYAIELKVGRNKATKLQEHTLKSIRGAGGITGVCYSVEDVQAVLENIFY